MDLLVSLTHLDKAIASAPNQTAYNTSWGKNVENAYSLT